MVAGFTMLLAKIASLLQWFSDLIVAIFVSLWDIFKDVFSWLFESVLSVSIAALQGIDISAITANLTGYAIPENVTAVMSACGLGTALAIISSALAIRFTLQLIPFVRLGS